MGISTRNLLSLLVITNVSVISLSLFIAASPENLDAIQSGHMARPAAMNSKVTHVGTPKLVCFLQIMVSSSTLKDSLVFTIVLNILGLLTSPDMSMKV